MDSEEPVVQVEVAVETPPSPAPVEVPDVTVVETGDTGIDGGMAQLLADHAAQLATLQAELDNANTRMGDTEIVADDAQQTADVAIEEAEEAVAEVAEMIAESEAQPEPEQDTQPEREHWFFR